MSRRTSSNTRLFTEEDEIDLLKSLSTSAGDPVTGGRVSKAQIRDKIRRLKQKYHKLARSESSIKTKHDRNIYEIGREIWGKEKTGMSSAMPLEQEQKRGSNSSRDGVMINWSDFPFLMREVSRVFPGMEELYKQGLKGLGEDNLKGLDEKWKALEIEAADIQARKAQLCHNWFNSEVSNTETSL